jgi:SAM-dependent methyltransferase
MATQATISPSSRIETGPPTSAPVRMVLFGLVIFSSAFLLFEVQPLIAKIILPWFGGVAAVWTVCLLFFQAVLLVGYLYAHLLTRLFRRATQVWIHVGLLGASLLALPIFPRDTWKPAGTGDPALHILLLLAVTIGLPYFLLSSTSPLLQAWYAQSSGSRTPYRLYAVSNLGSMLALLSYPVLVEPLVSSRHQAMGWSLAYAGVAVLCAALALVSRSHVVPAAPVAAAPRPAWTLQLLSVALAACGSALLLSITNHISQNIASVPFLWVLPLALYLLTFILCFEGRNWYHRSLFLRLLAVALASMTYAMSADLAQVPFKVLVPLFCSGLFICCMFCHGELARLKPDTAHLTLFYLMLSLGGALGALFVALLAPHLFRGLYELQVSLAACAILLVIVVWRDAEDIFRDGSLRPLWLGGALVLAVGLVASLYTTVEASSAYTRVMMRNFYGMLRVYERVDPKLHPPPGDGTQPLDLNLRYRELLNGTISHGLQFLGPSRRREPTTYYSRDSGVGLAIQLASRPGMRVGIIGLGAGTLAAYGHEGDTYTFYEINPLVVQVAENEFTYLRESAASTEIVPGDARLSLESEAPRGFDVLAVDAFSGDSIPTHLLTREAFAEYFRHLRPDGVLAIHISNRYLDLAPVVAAAAHGLNKPAMLVTSPEDDSKGVSTSSWVLITDRPNFFSNPDLQWEGRMLKPGGRELLWTDDYSSLLPLLE